MERRFGRVAHFRKSLTRRWSLSPPGLTQDTQAALFSAIVTSFLINALGDLGPDYQQQSALLLYQILNGRDPSLASISDPTAPFEPSGFAIAVNCLWFASLSASLGASFGAMICKEWLTEYNGGANPVINLLRACQRQIRFMAFQRWNVHTLISLLPPLLHSSVLLFFTGATIYLWQIDIRVAIVYLTIGGIFGITYFISTLLPFVMNAPFRPYSTLLVHQLSVAIGEIIMPIVDSIAHVCFLALRYMIGAFLWPFAQTIFNEGTLGAWYLRARTILPSEYKPMGVWWANAFNESLDEIDTDERVQEEAILWLSQMPLNLTQFKDMIPSLALISSSRPHKFQKSVVVFLNLTLESLSPETTGQAWPELAIDCLLVLERIKYQSVVDQDWDEDHNVGGISVSAVVARAAQKVVADASDKDSPHSEETRARLLAAAAWLSPVDATEEVTSDGKKLKIQDRWGFVEKLRAKLAQYIRGDGSLVDNKALISLVHGMHACIPRDDYGSTSSIVSFLLLVCDDYDSPWSKDESVLRALITYALDLLLPPSMRRPLVGREIGFDQLASELIDALRADATSPDVVAFGFWLVYRVPYAFRSRKWMLADIVYIWTLANANETIQQVLRQRVNFHAVDAFVAVAQHHHASPNRTLPKLAYNTLDLLKTALEDSYAQPMATYAVAMILGLGPSSQVTSFTRGVSAESFTKVLHTVRSDLEKNTTEEEIIDLHIYSTLVLLKLRPPQEDAETAKALIEEDVEMVKALIEEMKKTIEDPVLGDSKAEVSADLDRVRWKAIYLCGLLFKLLPPGEWEEPIERVRERVRTLLRSGELSVAGDYERCVEPLDVGGLELAVQGRPTYTAFKAWIKGFPCFFLDGSVSGASI